MVAPVKRAGLAALTRSLRRVGYSEEMVAEAEAAARSAFGARRRTLAAHRSSVLQGRGIVWPASGRVRLAPIEVPLPGRGEVTVEIAASCVSPGTERAQYLRLPNARPPFPFTPGYSAAGHVVAIGPGVTDLAPGDLVALPKVPHASVVTAPVEEVYRVGSSVAPQEAALVYLAIIAGYGLSCGELAAAEDVCVVGTGPIGALAQRMALARGAGTTTVIAASRRREGLAMTGGASAFLVAGEDDAAIAALGAALVVDATGEPDALATALAAAGEGARVVLLGSPRGVTRDFPSGELRRKGLTLVGAHISTIVRRGRERGVDLIRTEGEAFLAALANGLRVADLAGGPVDPREADAFYRSLANSQSLGAFFDWTALPQDQRLRRRRIWARPATDARGAAYAGEPLPVPEPLQAHVAAQLADPFRDAAGRIRFALLGCGDIGVANAAAIAAAPNTELVACYDPDAELARDVAGRFGAQVAESVEALFERKDVDAAFLAVPHHLHLPLARLAAEAGLHVVVEKPLAHDLASAVAIVEATQRAGVALTVCFPFRYEPAVVAARYLFEAGAVGEFAGAVVSYHLDKPASYWRSGYSNRSVSDWRQSRALAGGGILIMNLTHHIDLARHIGRVEVDSVTATEEPGGDTVEDGIAVAVRYANGSLGTVAGQAASRGGLPGEFHVRGREGHVALEPAPRVHASHAVAGLSPGRWHALPTTPQPDVRAVFVSRFASALARGERPDVTADDALAVQAFVEAAYESSRRGEAVRPADLLARALA